IGKGPTHEVRRVTVGESTALILLTHLSLGGGSHAVPETGPVKQNDQAGVLVPDLSALAFAASSAARASAARASSSRPSDRNKLARASCILEMPALISIALSTLASASS